MKFFQHATEEIIALLKILALGNRQIDEGKVQPVTTVIKRLRNQAKRLQ